MMMNELTKIKVEFQGRTKDMNREELMRLIDDKLDEIFYDYQVSEGISSGDISPDYAFALDELKEKLADLIIESMDWNKPLYKQEFPDFDCELIIPEGYTDCSNGYDLCPHVERRVKYEGVEFDLIIWQDYKDPEAREYESDRFAFVIKESKSGAEIFSYHSEEWDEIEKLVANTAQSGCWEEVAIGE